MRVLAVPVKFFAIFVVQELQVLAKIAGFGTAGTAKTAGIGTTGNAIKKAGIAHAYVHIIELCSELLERMTYYIQQNYGNSVN